MSIVPLFPSTYSKRFLTPTNSPPVACSAESVLARIAKTSNEILEDANLAFFQVFPLVSFHIVYPARSPDLHSSGPVDTHSLITSVRRELENGIDRPEIQPIEFNGLANISAYICSRLESTGASNSSTFNAQMRLRPMPSHNGESLGGALISGDDGASKVRINFRRNDPLRSTMGAISGFEDIKTPLETPN